MRRNKFGVAPKSQRTLDGIVFDSKKEMTRYSTLRILEAAGEIRNLILQPKFDLHVNGVKVATYQGDFWYETDAGHVLEDVKGVKTPIYRLKKKMVEAEYGIEILET